MERKIKIKLLLLLNCIMQLSSSFAQVPYANHNLWMALGGADQVNAFAEDASYIYVGGDFSKVGPPTGCGAKLTTTSSNPDLTYCRPDGMVSAAISDGAGGWYIGGFFSTIVTNFSTTVTRNNIAHILSSGQLDLTWNPNADNVVYSMVLSGTDLYVGGSFTNIGGQTRNRIAKLTTAGTGTADATWDPNASSTVKALVVSGSNLYVAGSFNTIGGITRPKLAVVTTTGTGAGVATFSAGVAGGFEVRAIALGGTDLFIGGDFSQVTGLNRNYLAKVNATTGSADATWNPSPQGSSGGVNAIVVSGTDVYFGGEFTLLLTEFVFRNRIAKISATGTGTADATWNPNANGTVRNLVLNGTDVFVGGAFTTIGGANRDYSAKLSTAGTGTADAAWNPNSASQVYALCISGTNVYIGTNNVTGASIGCKTMANLARFDKTTGAVDATWNPNANGRVLTLQMAGTDLYAGGSFTSIFGQTRNRIARLSTISTGTVDATWNPNCNSDVELIKILPGSSSIYVSGSAFTSIGGQSRFYAARLSATGTGTADAWNPQAFFRDIVEVGSDLYLGGSFASAGGGIGGNLAKVNNTTGAGSLTWNVAVGGPVNSLFVVGNSLYVGGAFTQINFVPYNRLAKINITTAAADPSWNPNANNTVNSIKLVGNDVYVGGNFTTIGGAAAPRLAKVSLNTGTLNTTWLPNPSLFGFGVVNTIFPTSTDLYAGGTFQTVNAISPKFNLASFALPCVSPDTPTLTASNPTLCNGSPTTLSVSAGSLNSAPGWQWYNASCGTGTVGVGASLVVSPTVTTTYFARGEGGCVTTATCASITITVNNAPVISVNNGTICNGQSFTISPSGANAYTISGGSSVVTPTSNTSYNVIGASAQGCVSSNTAVSLVTVNASPTITVNSGAICSGNSFTITPVGASTYTYQGGSNVVSPGSTTSFTVQGTNASGCVGNTATSNVTVNTTPTVSANSGSICNGNSFTIVPSGATSYTITGGSSVVTPVSNTSYSITGTSSAGCLSTNTAVSSVTVNALPVISVNSGAICSGGSFTISPSGASTYTVSGGSSVVSPLTNTNYSVTGTSSLGCVSLVVAVSAVTVNASPTITINSGAICSGKSFTLVPGGANTYTISGGSNVVSPTTTTSYSVTGTSTAGCLGSNTAVSSVTVNSLPTVAVNSGSICAGQVFTLIGSGASTYTFSSGSTTVSPSATTAYSVTGTSSLGCVSSNTAVSNVTVNANPTITVNSATICSGATATLSASGASTYTWSNASNSSNITVSPTSNTSYTLNGTSSAGCSGIPQTVTVSVNAAPSIVVNSGTVCSGSSATLVATGVSTYSWSNGATTSSIIVSPTINTVYTINGTLTGCAIGASSTSSVTVNSLPSVAVNSGSICAGQVFTITASGANSYTYSGGSNVVSPAGSTTYSVTGTGANGCVSQVALSNITVNALPNISVNSGAICSGQVFTVVPSGATTYTYSGGSNTVSPTTSTSYSVTGTSAAGCISPIAAVSNVTVNVNPTLTVNSGSVCSGQTFTITASGANTYTYSGGSNIVTPAVSTGYSVTGTSIAGCISQAVVSNVTVAPLPTISVNSGAICIGNSYTINPSGASTYTVSGGSFVVSPTANTSYSITGTSALGCISSNAAVAAVTVNVLPIITVASATVCPGASGTLTAGGANTYTWSTGSNAQSITVNPATTTVYVVNGTSGAGCVGSSVSATVTIGSVPNITVGSATICAGKSATLSANGAVTYSWNTGSTSNPLVVTPTLTTTYTVTGASIDGCKSSATVTQSVSPLPNPVVATSNSLLCSGESVTLTASGGATYTWNTGATANTLVITPTITGTYTLTAASNAGCTKAVVVTQNVDACTGIKSIDRASGGLIVYPNPNAGIFFVQMDSEVELEVVDVVGKRVFYQAYEAGQCQIDIHTLANGIYFVRARSNNELKIKKIIKE